MIDVNFRCPACTGPLSEMPCGAYGCTYPTCGAKYPYKNEVLRFVATIDRGFDYRWQQHPKPQATTQGVFESKTGWAAEDLEGKLVLDAGCGCGRFTQVAAGFGARVVGVDGSSHAVEAAHALVPSARVVQADLLRLPFPDATFDAAFSIGVLHHTADPQAAFREVARVVRPGGEIAVWLYLKPGRDEQGRVIDPEVDLGADFLHAITRGCSPGVLYQACMQYATKMRDLGKWNPLQQVLRMSTSADDEECISDTFDWHTPKFRSGHSIPEIRRWFEEIGQVAWIGSFPVSMRGTRR